jgi:hypothetical protein
MKQNPTLRDLDSAHRRGHIYEHGGSWHCTNHGVALTDLGDRLIAPCCKMEVSKPIPQGGPPA